MCSKPMKICVYWHETIFKISGARLQVFIGQIIFFFYQIYVDEDVMSSISIFSVD